MHRILITLALALCLPACATVSTHPPTAMKAAPVGLFQSEKYNLYSQHRVIPTQSALSQIGYNFYTDRATLKYFDESGAASAVTLEKEAMKSYYSGRKAEIESLAAGLALGVIAGTSYGKANHSVFSASLVGLILGGLSGGLVGMGLWNWNYQPKAQALFSKACDTFNKQLASKLQMEINPTLSGISGTLRMTY